MSRLSAEEQKTLIKVRSSHQLIGLQLKIFSTFIDCYPYSLYQGSLKRFEVYRKDYVEYSQQYRYYAKPEEASDIKCDPLLYLLKKCLKTQHALNAHLSQHCRAHSEELGQSDSLKGILLSIQERVTQADHLGAQIEASRPLPVKFNDQYEKIKQEIEQKIVVLKSTFNGLRQGLIKGDSLRQLRNPRFYQSVGMKQSEFEFAKWQQHAIVTLRAQLNRMDDGWETQHIPSVLLPNGWLAFADYADLLIVFKIMKPEAILSALKNQQTLLADIYQSAQEKMRWLREQLGMHLPEVLRLQRIIQAYQRWDAYLKSMQTDWIRSASWESLMACQRGLTYEKKAYFQQCLQYPQTHLLVTQLYHSLQDNPQSGIEWIRILKIKKQTLRTEINRQESVLQTRWTRWQKVAATFALSINQQPDFQLGQLAAQAMTQQLDRHAPMKTLKEPLPPALAQKLNQAVGFSFLGIALWVSSRVGYYHHALGAVNRAVFAQITPLLQIGNAVDKVLTGTVLPIVSALEKKLNKMPQVWRAVKQGLRFDEVGILEKDKSLQWLNGLGMNVWISGQPLLASSVAYTVATLTSHSAMGLMDQTAFYWDITPELMSAAKLAAHFALYSAAYREGLIWSKQWGFYPEAQLSHAEALTRLGLTSDATDQQIRRQYRQLSKQVHPDKCNTEECVQKMLGLNEAHEVLLKKS